MTTLVIPTEAPSVHGPPQGHWTYHHWEQLPDDGNRYEVIAGAIYVTIAPSSFHQWIVQQLVELIGIPAKRQGLAFGFPSPIGVLIPGCDPVQPDYVVVLSARREIIRERRIRGVPDVIVEILSPGNAAYDEEVKLEAYADAGVPEYVIVDPRNRSLSHYQLAEPGRFEPPRTVDIDGQLVLHCLPTLVIPVAELFAGAPDTTL